MGRATDGRRRRLETASGGDEGGDAWSWLETAGRASDNIMPSISLVREYTQLLTDARDQVALSNILEAACAEMNCSFFALTHHVDFRASPGSGLRIHNYPEAWMRWFDERKLGLSDPVHRASHLTARGFHWNEIPKLIRLSPLDQDVLAQAWYHGIGDGYSIPANVPGETLGSCSFATKAGTPMAEEWVYFAQWVGLFAFEAARRISGTRPFDRAPALTERQSECAVWIGRGKTDWEISKILGISRETVVDHLRNARARCETTSRAGIVASALYDGSISFTDIFKA